jgi:acetyl-CoA carboxylase biotin carboxyl carrier protein
MVADDMSQVPPSFDVQTIRQLVTLMSRHDLSEIDLRDGPQRIRLRRVMTTAPIAAVPTAVIPAAEAPVSAPTPVERSEPKPTKVLHEIKSPTPGTFYAAANPDAQPFVKVGARVTPTTPVCMIEAMKLFNEIPAECTGVITEILVENQQAVEYGQVLFRVDTTA